MAYEVVQSGRKQYIVDWTVVRRLLLSYYVARLQWDSSREVTMSESHWYNPATWSMPDVTHIEVDWERVHANAAACADEDVRVMREAAKRDARSVAYQLEWAVDEAYRLKELFLDDMADVQTRNMQRISSSTEGYEGQVELLKFLRDTSADGLMVGATILSGGAGFAAMRSGSILKGVAKWEDSGSLGAGVLEAEGAFVFGYVKLGKSFSFKESMVIAVVQGVYKTGTELVAGSSLKKALVSGGLKMTGPSIDRIFKGDTAMSFFDRVAVPFAVTYGGKNVAAQLLAKWAGKAAMKQGVEGYGKQVLLGGHPPAPEGHTKAGLDYQKGVLADATVTNRYLLYLAFVDAEQGIGHGWQ